jgi:diaminohydroxyphosphoribosylaminopyrimidine deaminase / 5-amino-6-(5-phosphoribosylamino)uracil reductase
VVFDRGARLPPDSALVRTARDVPTIVVAESPNPERAARLEASGVTVVHAGSLEDALEQLRRREVRSLLVEGGARLAGALLERALVDRLIIFQAPVLLGAGALNAFAYAPSMSVGAAERYEVLERRALGSDTVTVYALGGRAAGETPEHELSDTHR